MTFSFWYLIKVVQFFDWKFHAKAQTVASRNCLSCRFLLQFNEPQMEHFPKRHSNLLNKKQVVTYFRKDLENANGKAQHERHHKYIAMCNDSNWKKN